MNKESVYYTVFAYSNNPFKHTLTPGYYTKTRARELCMTLKCQASLKSPFDMLISFHCDENGVWS